MALVILGFRKNILWPKGVCKQKKRKWRFMTLHISKIRFGQSVLWCKLRNIYFKKTTNKTL